VWCHLTAFLIQGSEKPVFFFKKAQPTGVFGILLGFGLY